MSQENLEIVRRAHAALAEEGIEAMLAFTDSEFEVTTPPSLASEPDTYRGHDGIRRWFDSFSDGLENVSLEGREFTAAGDQVLVDTLLRARGRSTGIEVEQDAFLLWTLREGMVVRGDVFAERGPALEAAGLSDQAVPEENVEIVRTALTALDQHDLERYLTVASTEIELINPASPLEGPSIGHEGIRRFFSEMETFAKSSRFEVEEIRVVGPRVLALFKLTAIGRASGARTSVDLAGVYSIEDGKIRRAHIFVDRGAALEAAGLPSWRD